MLDWYATIPNPLLRNVHYYSLFPPSPRPFLPPDRNAYSRYCYSSLLVVEQRQTTKEEEEWVVES
jgi:hypothetical protein